MPTYVMSLNWTGQGARHSRDTLVRARAFGATIQNRHGKVPKHQHQSVARHPPLGGCRAGDHAFKFYEGREILYPPARKVREQTSRMETITQNYTVD